MKSIAPKVLVADPPWKLNDSLPGPKRGASKHYELMPLSDICSFDIPLMAPDSYLFLWRLSSYVEEAYQVVRAWGFTPKSEIIWLKRTAKWKRWFGMGNHVRAEHETCIIAVRGSPKPKYRNQRSTFEAQVGKHSQKPEEFYEIIEYLCEGPYIELFARQRRENWQCYGNELV